MKNLFKKQLKEQKGITLIMVLLILAGISATSLTVSVIIVNELMASKNTDEAMIAYYAAETGVEKGLYHFKENKDGSASDIKKTFTDETLSNDAKRTGTKIDQQSSLMTNLIKNQTIQLNLYDPENVGVGADKIDQLKISGMALGAGSLNDPEAKLEVSYISWPENFSGNDISWAGSSGEPNYPTTTEIYTKSDLVAGKLKDFSAEFLVYHIVRLKALYNNISNLKIEAKKTDETPPIDPPTDVPIPTGFIISSTGQYNQAKQALTAGVSWQKTVNGLFNYVLFTKEELEKK